MSVSQSLKDRRMRDSFLDRRSGDDRRRGFDLGYFAQGSIDKRNGMERRKKDERRDQYARIDKWSSICAAPKSAVAKTSETQLRQAQSLT
jgi:hypothetical protein